MNRIIYSSGGPWEDVFGYSRVVRTGNIIEVSGTTATDGETVIGKGDYYLQTKYILQKIEKHLISAGSSMTEVSRTRIYVKNISKWKEVARAHQEFFGKIKPAATMVEITNLISPDMLVEIEVTAVTD
jgi:enamine deaminase RidA (YjgF/YER057c/UK114 family)